MKYVFLLFSFSVLLFASSCSDDNSNNLKPPDFSDLIRGIWTGNTLFLTDTMTVADTLFFELNLDASENQISGTSKFILTPQPVEILNVTGLITYPKVTMDFLSDKRAFDFSGNFSATNSKVITGTLQNEKYGSLPITFTKQ